VTPIGVQQDGGEKIAKDAIKVVHLDADSTTTDYVSKFLGSVFIGCVGLGGSICRRSTLRTHLCKRRR